MAQKMCNILVIRPDEDPLLLTSTTKEELLNLFDQRIIIEAFLIANSQEIVRLTFSAPDNTINYTRVTNVLGD